MAIDANTSPLHEAAGNGELEAVNALLASGVQVDLRTRHFETPLMRAAYRGRLEIVSTLIRAGADVDAQRRPNSVHNFGKATPLSLAARVGHFRVCRTLLEAGAKVDPLDSSYFTPLAYACDAGNLELCKLLLDFGANPNGPAKGTCPLYHAVGESFLPVFEKRQWDKATVLKLVQELLARGADPNGRVGNGETPLHATLDVDIAKLLIATGADINARDLEGQTCLMKLMICGSIELLSFFIESGVNVNKEPNAYTSPLMKAFDRPRETAEVIEMLIRAGADPSLPVHGKVSLREHYEWVLARSHNSPEELIERRKAIQFLKDYELGRSRFGTNLGGPTSSRF